MPLCSTYAAAAAAVAQAKLSSLTRGCLADCCCFCFCSTSFLLCDSRSLLSRLWLLSSGASVSSPLDLSPSSVSVCLHVCGTQGGSGRGIKAYHFVERRFPHLTPSSRVAFLVVQTSRIQHHLLEPRFCQLSCSRQLSC